MAELGYVFGRDFVTEPRGTDTRYGATSAPSKSLGSIASVPSVAVDLARSRSKRIFGDRTGQRCGQNQRPYLLQTYQRDTGEVMHDLSVPIVVSGRHWGAFRIGYRSAR